jgi:hypothetical protein
MNPFYAMIRPDSSVAFVASMGVSETERNNALSEGLEAVPIPEGTSPEEVVTSWYYIQGEWKKAPVKPSEYHVFDIPSFTWIDTRTTETQLELIRNTRNFLLAQSDWTMLPDIPMSSDKKAEWVAYRQELRNVTLQPDLFNIVWPTPPQE